MDSMRFFFFKQKTAYEMRSSDWSSDVCSSDLVPDAVRAAEAAEPVLLGDHRRIAKVFDQLERRAERQDLGPLDLFNLGGEPPRIAGVEIGRASCRERVCQYV